MSPIVIDEAPPEEVKELKIFEPAIEAARAALSGPFPDSLREFLARVHRYQKGKPLDSSRNLWEGLHREWVLVCGELVEPTKAHRKTLSGLFEKVLAGLLADFYLTAKALDEGDVTITQTPEGAGRASAIRTISEHNRDNIWEPETPVAIPSGRSNEKNADTLDMGEIVRAYSDVQVPTQTGVVEPHIGENVRINVSRIHAGTLDFVVLELLKNAFQAQPAGAISVSVKRDGAQVIVSVTNKGHLDKDKSMRIRTSAVAMKGWLRKSPEGDKAIVPPNSEEAQARSSWAVISPAESLLIPVDELPFIDRLSTKTGPATTKPFGRGLFQVRANLRKFGGTIKLVANPKARPPTVTAVMTLPAAPAGHPSPLRKLLGGGAPVPSLHRTILGRGSILINFGPDGIVRLKPHWAPQRDRSFQEHWSPIMKETRDLLGRYLNNLPKEQKDARFSLPVYARLDFFDDPQSAVYMVNTGPENPGEPPTIEIDTSLERLPAVLRAFMLNHDLAPDEWTARQWDESYFRWWQEEAVTNTALQKDLEFALQFPYVASLNRRETALERRTRRARSILEDGLERLLYCAGPGTHQRIDVLAKRLGSALQTMLPQIPQARNIVEMICQKLFSLPSYGEHDLSEVERQYRQVLGRVPAAMAISDALIEILNQVAASATGKGHYNPIRRPDAAADRKSSSVQAQRIGRVTIQELDLRKPISRAIRKRLWELDSFRRYAEFWKKRPELFIVFLAFDSEGVVQGFLHAGIIKELRTAKLLFWIVHPAFRRRGIAKSLLGTAMRKLAEMHDVIDIVEVFDTSPLIDSLNPAKGRITAKILMESEFQFRLDRSSGSPDKYWCLNRPAALRGAA